MNAFDTASRRYLLDTNIISTLMRSPGGRAAESLKDVLTRWPDAGVGTSVIVDCELIYGLRLTPSHRLQRAYDTVMASIDVRALEKDVGGLYASVRTQLTRRGTPVGPNDTLIAAHALALGAILVTDNEEEFRRVPGLQVENWLR
jgi:tRNA(fMet)-specific endonuclease VapC